MSENNLTDKKSFFASTKNKLILLLGLLAAACIIAAVVIAINKYQEGVTAEQEAQKALAYYNDALTKQQEVQNQIIEYQGYTVIGKLIIDRIGLSLPVLDKSDTTALSVSICHYQGPLPGEDGNMVITGHNYANGAVFGSLDKMKIGDSVILETPNGEKYTYQVYDIEKVNPDDVASLNRYEGRMAITLLTCANNANKRLLVRCKIVQ
jgi:LPXTG-site transpeptidase (sortase) family protein